MIGNRRLEAGTGERYLSLAYRLRRAVDAHMVNGGLSLARTKMLQVLDRRGPLRQASLAAELGLAPRSISQAVEAMERDRLVTRLPHPDDHRAKLVTLTSDGSAALAAGAAAGERILLQIFGRLSPDQLATLDELLGILEAGTVSGVAET